MIRIIGYYGIIQTTAVEIGYPLKAGLRSRWLSGVEAGGGIRFDSAQRTTPKLSQLKREADITSILNKNTGIGGALSQARNKVIEEGFERTCGGG